MKAIKLCGLTDENDVRVARELGVEFAGFVFAESPRRVDAERGAILRRGFDGCETRVVGVFAGEAPERIEEIAREVRLDLVQLHGDARAPASGIPVIRALKVREGIIAKAPAGERPEWYLLDAFDPEVEGGSGRPFDWEAARPIELPRPFLLAGGLNSENVGRAIATLRPEGVDVSSGIEENPGVKSEEKMRRFVAAVREAFERRERE